MIDVVAGVISRDGKILIARRNNDKHMGGLWEFPGGKIEENEAPEKALERELFEEFGIVTKIGKFLTANIFDYGKDKKIRLSGFLVEHVSGEFVLNDHSEIAWISKDQFPEFEFAPADLPIIEKLLC